MRLDFFGRYPSSIDRSPTNQDSILDQVLFLLGINGTPANTPLMPGKGGFDFSLFDFSRSFVFLKRWPYWPLQKNETPRPHPMGEVD